MGVRSDMAAMGIVVMDAIHVVAVTPMAVIARAGDSVGQLDPTPHGSRPDMEGEAGAWMAAAIAETRTEGVVAAGEMGGIVDLHMEEAGAEEDIRTLAPPQMGQVLIQEA